MAKKKRAKKSVTPTRVVVAASMPPDLVDRLDVVSDQFGISRSKLIVEAVSDWLAEAEMQANFVSDKRVMKAFAEAFAQPGVMSALAKTMGEEIDAKKAQHVLDFFRHAAGESKEQPKKRRSSR